MTGSACGARRLRGGGPARRAGGPGIGWFVRADGGYTTVALAVALLVSLSLAFGTAAAQWALARSADVQEVADASALAGERCVAAYVRVVQAVDACALTMGVAGMVTCGAGLVVAAIPGLQTKAPAVLSAGGRILAARREFCATAQKGLACLERALPALVMANAASCAAANGTGGMRYVGLAVPFPQTSRTALAPAERLDADELRDHAERLAEASARKQRAHERAEQARERAWRADNVDEPRCLWSRAASLAGLGGQENPRYETPQAWEFEFARLRARNYYAARTASEAPSDGGIEALQRSAARVQFFGYAFEALGEMSCLDTKDEVAMDLQVLPHTTDMVMQTRLYTDVVWPCSQEEAGRTLHCSLACPGATGVPAGVASLADIDAGGALRCATCRMDARAMGNVADASTNIDNGFEHYWRIVAEASREYEDARLEEIAAEREMQTLAERGAHAFDEAIDALSGTRPRLCPPGAWGCVSVVARPGVTSVPTELTAAFLSGASLPAGAAVSAATLAPDGSSETRGGLGRLPGEGRAAGTSLDLVGNVTRLWRDLLGACGSDGGMQGVGAGFLEDVEGTAGERVATWLRAKLAGVVSRVGLRPEDLRARRPVLVNSQAVLDKAGATSVGEARRLLGMLPSTSQELLGTLRARIAGTLGSRSFTVAELPVPGAERVRVPLRVDLAMAGLS